MYTPIPEHHSNPETVKLEPACIFTDKAIVFPPKAPPGPAADGPESEEKAQPDEPEDGGN